MLKTRLAQKTCAAYALTCLGISCVQKLRFHSIFHDQRPRAEIFRGPPHAIGTWFLSIQRPIHRRNVLSIMIQIIHLVVFIRNIVPNDT